MYYALIMAGGKGTRLWPLSREKTPKHTLKLVDDRTMFQHTVERLRPLFSPEQVFVITAAEHYRSCSTASAPQRSRRGHGCIDS